MKKILFTILAVMCCTVMADTPYNYLPDNQQEASFLIGHYKFKLSEYISSFPDSVTSIGGIHDSIMNWVKEYGFTECDEKINKTQDAYEIQMYCGEAERIFNTATDKHNAFLRIVTVIRTAVGDDSLPIINSSSFISKLRNLAVAASYDVAASEQAVFDELELAIASYYSEKGKAEALGEMGTPPQTGCAAVEVTKDDKTVTLYAPEKVKIIKKPAID